MKTIKLALLGTAALAAASMTAKADELSALKAQIEALNTRMSQIEAAPAVPAGYQLLTISEATATGWDEKRSDFVGKTRNATVIGIMPTADMPATTTIEWHGEIRTALTYSDSEDWAFAGASALPTGPTLVDFNSITNTDDLDVNVRGRLWVRATTDTAVGEVGVRIRLESRTGISDNSEAVRMDRAWGWWQMTPELQLAGGYNESLVTVHHGLDWQSTFGNTGGITNRDTDAMRLTYSSGPMSFAIALEESEAGTLFAPAVTGLVLGPTTGFWAVLNSTIALASGSDRGDMPAIAARFAYAGDTLSASVQGVWQDDDLQFTSGVGTTAISIGGDDDWFVGAGLTYSGDMFLVSAALGAGEGYAGAYNGAGLMNTDDSYWGGSILARVNVSDATYFEAGYGYSELDQDTFPSTFLGDGEVDTHTFNAGIYYAPVNQLTIGLQADYRIADYSWDISDAVAPIVFANPSTEWDTESFSASLVTWFNF